MLAIIGALALTGAFLWLTWAVFGLAYVLFAMGDFSLDGWLFWAVWFVMWGVAAFAWWTWVGSQVSVSFA